MIVVMMLVVMVVAGKRRAPKKFVLSTKHKYTNPQICED
jgi:hypothetical protein